MKQQPVRLNTTENLTNILSKKLTQEMPAFLDKKLAVKAIDKLLLLLNNVEKRNLMTRSVRCDYFTKMMDTHNGNRRIVHNIMSKKFKIKPQNVKHACDHCEDLYKRLKFK